MRFVCLLVVFTAVLAMAPIAAAASPDATASKSCRVGDTRSYGTTYVTSINVSGTSCRSGRRVIRAFHGCRPGKSGRCNKRVLGYSCSESRQSGRTQYDSRVTCRNGGKVVKHRYTQFT